MTSRERLAAVLRGQSTDCVPVSPDTSNMIPARMTGKSFIDLYLYEEIPMWQAYINCVRHFGFDALMDGSLQILFDDLDAGQLEQQEYIVYEDNRKIITRRARSAGGKLFWNDTARIYTHDNPPANVHYQTIGLDETPITWRKVVKRSNYPTGAALLRLVKEEMGSHGLVGITCGTSLLVNSERAVYDYFDDPGKYIQRRDQKLEYYVKRFQRLMSLEVKPDFICTGGSGSLVFQTVEMFRELALPIVQTIARLCKENGIPSHLHCCGPEAEMVKICAEETNLTVIDPLELPPMGNCVLREIKKLYGQKLVLKGNLHTTDVMLLGTPGQVAAASRQAIDDAAEGGRFILSTGDQCGRDTPDENLFAMIETARTYGKYPLTKESASI